MSSGYDMYRETAIRTAPPEQLIVLLYDGALRFLDQAKTAMESGNDASQPIGRTQDILVELTTSLDRSAGTVAENLSRLYDFWIQRLFAAQINQDVTQIEEVATMVRELRDAWATVIMQKRGPGQMAAASLNARG
jgi:flagellar protein FliS